MTSDCERLDAFVCDELDSAAAARFETHLARCPACRAAVDQQQWIDTLLRSPARAELEPPPETLIKSLPTTTTQRRRRARLIACGLATAAALLVAAGWILLLNRQADLGHVPRPHDIALDAGVAESTDAPSPDTIDDSHSTLAAAPRGATFVGTPDVIVVPVDSQHADVTVFRVYHTFRPSYSTQANIGQSTTANDFVRPADFNGG